MSQFDEREQAFEKKFAHDAETKFKAEARRNKYLGLWLAESFGLSGEAATAYAGEVIASDLKEEGFEDVIAKVMADIAARSVDVSEDAVRAKIREFDAKAKDEILNEKG
ncbi:MAG: DUF1476 domain-containing protein [Pseudomonadota bacterium]